MVSHIYSAVPGSEDADRRTVPERTYYSRKKLVVIMSVVALALLSAAAAIGYSSPLPFCSKVGCDTVEHGYQCATNISHSWGQYSPYFSVPSEISDDIPPQCTVDFVQILSRHGARDPTSSKTTSYNNTITKINKNVKNYTGIYSFLADYEYTLGADQLTHFGQQQMINSGIKFYSRYAALAAHNTPFVRSSSEARVVESAQNWTQGFHATKLRSIHTDPAYPYPLVVISEASGSNNTLNHGLCSAFEDGPDSTIASLAQAQWTAIFIPPIQKRLNTALPGANLSTTDTINLLDLCPFNTVASTNGTISPFCALFTPTEWAQYNYYESLNKYYGYGAGNPLGPTQGVGFTNELIARLTSSPVNDSTSTNHTLDSNPATLPLGKALYADFSHDNDLTSIFFAMGLYDPPLLSNTSVETMEQTGGYSAAATVPFASRMYVERMRCADRRGEKLVRVLVNDRVIPLRNCGVDELGRCEVGQWVESLGFAQGGGLWGECFKGNGTAARR
ncbi:hypothetical protein MBLNU457_4431t1 [Dothideomycetes sp. NU457]